MAILLQRHIYRKRLNVFPKTKVVVFHKTLKTVKWSVCLAKAKNTWNISQYFLSYLVILCSVSTWIDQSRVWIHKMSSGCSSSFSVGWVPCLNRFLLVSAALQIPEYCRVLEESEISEHCFDLIFAFDEIVALGYRENVNLAQIRTFTEMDSHEEKVFRAVREVRRWTCMKTEKKGEKDCVNGR